MREAMAAAVVGDDVLGDDPTVQELEAKSAKMLGKDAALFVPSGTMGNEMAINVWSRPGDEIIVEARSHVYLYEGAGTAVISGVQVCPIETDDGVMPIDKIRASLRDSTDIHCPRTSLVCIENTHNILGGRVLPIDYLRLLRAFTSEHGLRIHLDGARLFNASCATGIPAAEYAALADSVMFCLSKGLCAPIGSMLVGDSDFIERARRVRKMLGGGMRQVGVIAAPAIISLDSMVDRLVSDNENCHQIAVGIAELPGLLLDPETVETNILIAHLERPAPSAGELCEALEARGVLGLPLGDDTVRFVTHHDVDADDVARLVDAMREVLRG